jgi:hypothetical protein
MYEAKDETWSLFTSQFCTSQHVRSWTQFKNFLHFSDIIMMESISRKLLSSMPSIATSWVKKDVTGEYLSLGYFCHGSQVWLL